MFPARSVAVAVKVKVPTPFGCPPVIDSPHELMPEPPSDAVQAVADVGMAGSPRV